MQVAPENVAARVLNGQLKTEIDSQSHTGGGDGVHRPSWFSCASAPHCQTRPPLTTPPPPSARRLRNVPERSREALKEEQRCLLLLQLGSEPSVRTQLSVLRPSRFWRTLAELLTAASWDRTGCSGCLNTPGSGYLHFLTDSKSRTHKQR